MTNTYETLVQKFGGNLRETNMQDTDYKDKKVYWLEFNGASCPICGHSNWCMVNVTGTKVICQRVANDHKLPNLGGYLYKLDDSYRVNFDEKNYRVANTFKKAPDSILDLLYRSVLLAYPLLDKHRTALHNRGLDDEMLNLHKDRGFGSFYTTRKEANLDDSVAPLFSQMQLGKANGEYTINNIWQNVLDNLQKQTNDSKYNKDLWQGVPGFSMKSFSIPNSTQVFSGPVFKAPVGGLLVPYYNILNELVGFQSRVDNVSLWAKVTKPLPGANIQVMIDSKTREYTVTIIGRKHTAGVKIASGIASSNIVDLSYGGVPYQFEVVEGGKYFWVSSSKDEGGATGKMPIQVAYNPFIAKLDPTHPDDRKKIKDYIAKPKSVWLTEGGLKGFIASAYLAKTFSDTKLDEVGRDVLAVAGVNSYRHFLPILKKLNVTTVTTAYDMDFQSNEQVKANYKNLISMLRENGFKVRIANWDGDKAKGIDDALVQKLEINFAEVN